MRERESARTKKSFIIANFVVLREWMLEWMEWNEIIFFGVLAQSERKRIRRRTRHLSIHNAKRNEYQHDDSRTHCWVAYVEFYNHKMKKMTNILLRTWQLRMSLNDKLWKLLLPFPRDGNKKHIFSLSTKKYGMLRSSTAEKQQVLVAAVTTRTILLSFWREIIKFTNWHFTYSFFNMLTLICNTSHANKAINWGFLEIKMKQRENIN